MKAYLAAPYAARAQVREFAAQLTRIGYTVTSSWLGETHEIAAGTVGAATAVGDDEVAAHARADLADIDRSDLLVLITESVADLVGGTATSGGRHVETGYAVALSKPVLVVGDPENVFHRYGRICMTVPSWREAVIELAHRLVDAERNAPPGGKGMSTDNAELRDELVDVFQKAWHHADEHCDGPGSRTQAGIDAVLATGLVAVVEEPPIEQRASSVLDDDPPSCSHCGAVGHTIGAHF